MTRKIGVALVGCGRISGLHAAGYLAHPDSTIVAVCDPNVAAIRARGEEWGVPVHRQFETLPDLLELDEVDVVDVLVPHHLHEEVALAVIAAGKHLSLQKPMATTLQSADRIIAAADEAGVVLKVFENFLFHAPIETGKRLIEDGTIGDVLSIRLRSHSGYSPSAWEVPPATAAWRLDPEMCGGGPLVFDDGHHKFATAWHLVGSAESVYADIGDFRGTGIDSPSSVTWRHESGAVGHLEVVYAPETLITTKYYPQDDPVEITGTKGVIWIRGGHGRLVDAPAISWYRDGSVTDLVGLETDWGVSFLRSAMHFIDTLKSGHDPCLTGSQGREVLAFTLAAQQSAQLKKPVDPSSLT